MSLRKIFAVIFPALSLVSNALAADPVFLQKAAISSGDASSEKKQEIPGSISSLLMRQTRTEDYLIQPEDVLQITVYEEPDLTAKARVTGTGEIIFPLLGHVVVAGLSVNQVQEKITKALEADYLVNPQVQVFIESYHERNVFVTGSVNKPGSYPLSSGKPTTLMEAVAMAGGFREDAAVNSTRVIRLQNGKETTLTVRAKDIQKGDKNKDVEVLPNDVVFVPESIF